MKMRVREDIQVGQRVDDVDVVIEMMELRGQVINVRDLQHGFYEQEGNGRWEWHRSWLEEVEEKPPGDPDFHAVLKEMGEVHSKKQADYGTIEDPYANYRSSEDIGIPAWKNAFLRTTEKVNRVKSFIRNGKLENEGIEDAFMDIAVTAIISLVTYREQREKK